MSSIVASCGVVVKPLTDAIEDILSIFGGAERRRDCESFLKNIKIKNRTSYFGGDLNIVLSENNRTN